MEIQLAIAINFISSKDTNEERAIHSKRDNIEIVIYGKAHEVIEELFQSLLFRYEIVNETSMKGSDFIFDCAHLLSYKCRKVV